MLCGMEAIEWNRYMEDSKDPVKKRAPVRKRFPMDAEWKLKRELGR